MDLFPVAQILPGCSADCPRSIIPRGANNFAYCSPRSVLLFSGDARYIPNISPDAAAAAPPANNLPNPRTPLPPPVSVSAYNLRNVFGAELPGNLIAVDMNEEYVAGLTRSTTSGGGQAVRLWRAATGEDVSRTKLHPTLHDVLAREGGATTMCVAGKHHLLFGTQYGKLISLNTNENHEPRCVAMPPPPALNGQKVGAITAIAVSPVRADIVAAGTADGCLAFFSLNAATGLNPTGVLLPFGTTSSSSSNTNNTSSTASASTFANNASSSNITSGAVEKHPISALSFDVVNQNYLAVGTIDGGLVLCDVMASSIVASFSYKEAPEANKVSSLTWIRGETGAFYSASSTTNKMFKWSINAKTPVAAFCPAEAMTCERTPTKVGVVSCATLEKDRVVVALTTGAVKVFSVAAQRVVFQSADAAPRGVLSDVSISPYDRDFAASCGADGNLYVHNLRQMSLHYVVRPLADQQPQHRHAHSVAWSPNGKLIAVSFSSGEVVAYAISTRRLAWRTQVFAKAAVRMEWAPTSASDSILVVSSAAGEVALLSTKEGKIQRRFVPSKPHVGGGTPTPARGALAVELVTTGVMAVANCVVGDDHNICLFSVSQGAGEEPWMILSGHTGTVHDVSFNPSLPNLLVSASADSTIRVWDLSSRDARTIHASARVLSAGTQSGAITSLGWCSIAPYLLLSGGEGGLRVWDVRSGAAITTVASSTSPSAVCSISSSPERPTIFATASQDGAVVLWQLGALRGIAIHAALGALDQTIVSDASQLFTSSTPSSGVTPFKGTGAAVERLAKELRENTNAKPAERMAKVLQFFDLPIGAVDLAHMASFASDPTTFAVDGKDVVQPASKLLDARRARAKQIVDKARGKSATAAGVEYQRERLVEAAEEVLRVGNFEEHCQLLMEAEQWDRAIAVAPIVSREFWRNACIRAGEAMEASGDATRAMTYFIMGEESTRAARLAGRFRHDQLDAGIAVEQSCPQRNLAASVAPGTTLPPGAVPPETSHCTTVDANGVSAQVKELQRERLTSGLERFNSPRLFAAAQVSNGKGDAAVRLLENAGDVVAAHLLVHTVPLQEQGSIDAAYRMTMLLCARQGFWETALLCSTRLSNPYDGMATVLALYQSSLAQQHQVHQMPQHVMLEKLRTFTDQVRQESQKLQLPLDANMIQQRHASDGLASQNQLAAMVMSADAAAGPITSSMILQSVSGFMESLLQVALQDADGANTSFYLTQALHVSQYVSLPVVRGASNNNAQAPGSSIPSLPNAATTTSMGQLSPEHRKFLALALLTSALMCVKVFRFPKLLNPAFAKARELAQGDAAVEALLGKAQPLLGAYSTHSVELDCNTEGGLIAMMNERGQTRTSTITGEPIFGALHVCDDGQSVMARTEALAWAQCCAFSPLGTGARHIAA